MSSLETCAYPYAKAVFNLALRDNTTNFWLTSLNIITHVINTAGFNEVLFSPNLSHNAIIELLLSVVDQNSLPQDLSKLKNLLFMLGENNKLAVIPYLYMLYKSSVDKYNNVLQVTIYSAYAIEDTLKNDLDTKLAHKLGKVIHSTIVIDTDLIGGIKIVINDIVIDMSIKGGLDKLATQLI